jgi:hypothetical protein
MDLASGAPKSFIDLLLLPGLLSFFAVVTRLLLYASERTSGNKSKGRWFAYLLALLGLFFGWRVLWALINPSTGALYRSTFFSRKMLWSHYIAFFMPLAVLIGLFLWDRFGSKRMSDRHAYDM